jgi:hypothetical protein
MRMRQSGRINAETILQSLFRGFKDRETILANYEMLGNLSLYSGGETPFQIIADVMNRKVTGHRIPPRNFSAPTEWEAVKRPVQFAGACILNITNTKTYEGCIETASGQGGTRTVPFLH